MFNFGTTPKKVGLGEAIAQMTIHPLIKCVWRHTHTLEKTERGERGFGSSDERTDKKDKPTISWE